MNDTQLLLVDSARGIYAWDSLAKRYPLYVRPAFKGPYVPFEKWLLNNSDVMGAAYTVKDVFNPDYCENIEYMDKLNLSVLNDSGEYWRIEQVDGDIWAINPRAVWSDENEAYELPQADLFTVTMPAHWASALINMDYSGLSADDRTELNNFLVSHEPCLSFVDCLDVGAEYIGRFAGKLCNVADYVYKL
jgi:hypothetical protein